MRQLTMTAPAKINLSLDVTGRRDDGYHLLATVMQSIDLADQVTVVLEPGRPGIRLTCGGAPIPADSRNTAWRAAALFMEQVGLADGVSITLKKKIPSAAGLAGGSSDAAAVLAALDRLSPGAVKHAHLFETAARIGADVPFCLQGGTCLCEGIGEILTPLTPWPDLDVLLVKPAFGMSTPWVFSRFRLDNPGCRPDQSGVIAAVQSHDLTALATATANVLESVSMPARPLLGEIKRQLLSAGAVIAQMSGSGPTIFGLFPDPETCMNAKAALTASLPADTMILTARTIRTGPVPV